MKATVLAPLLILAAVSAVVVLNRGKGTPDPVTEERTAARPAPEPAAGPGLPASRALPPPVLPAPTERQGWAKFRPPEEENLPDPNGVGPCPPPQMNNGAGASRVMRRGIDPDDGYPTWWHEDGSITKIQPSLMLDETGKQVPVPTIVNKAPTMGARIDIRTEDPRGQAANRPSPDRGKTRN